MAEHYPRFIKAIETSGGQLPAFVRLEIDGYLQEHLAAFSRKRQGFCSNCGARRMVESAAHLVDHLLPEAPEAIPKLE